MMVFIRWLITIAWMVLIFYLSSIPGIDIPPGPKVVPVIIHYLEFFILTILLAWAINDGLLRNQKTSVLTSAFIVAVFYGIIDELYQLYVPGRVTDMLDILVNSLGALSAVLLLPLFAAFYHRRKAQNE